MSKHLADTISRIPEFVWRAMAYAKSIAAGVGSVATFMLTVLPPDQFKWLGLVAAVCTAIGTWAVPNVPYTAAAPIPAVPPLPAK